MSCGEKKYRWTETGALDHYRQAHALDHLAGVAYVGFGVSLIPLSLPDLLAPPTPSTG